MTDRQAFPATCGLCGTMKNVDDDRTVPVPAPAGGVKMEFFDVCANPDCPGNESDLAKAAERP